MYIAASRYCQRPISTCRKGNRSEGLWTGDGSCSRVLCILFAISVLGGESDVGVERDSNVIVEG